MSSFVATASPAPAASPIDGVVTNDGWYPDVSLTDMRDAMRLDGTLTAERIRHATRDAVLSVNCELSAWRTRQVAAGHAALDDVPAVRVDGESAFVHHYLRAVYHCAYADVT